MSDAPLNLDKLAAERAQGMVQCVKDGVNGVKKPVETLERLATKTLGVLQAQGVYAMILFLYSRTSDEKLVAERCILPELFFALHELPANWAEQDIPQVGADTRTALKFYADKVLNDLDTLLLVRDLYEQTLIYARYHAKAVKEG